MRGVFWIKNLFYRVYRFVKPFKDERLNFFFLMSVFLVLIYSWRIFDLSYFKKDYWIKQVRNQFAGKIKLAPPKGAILDRNGTVLAASEKVVSFYVRPSEIKDWKLFESIILRNKKVLQEYSSLKKVPVDKLENLLLPFSGITKEDLEKAYKKKYTVVVIKKSNGKKVERKVPFVWLKKRLSVGVEESARAVRVALRIYYALSGENRFKKRYPDILGYSTEYKRVYPYAVGSTVVGITSPFGEGLTGLERYLERKKLIVGKSVVLTGRKDARGRVYLGTNATLFVTKEKGKNVELTIDGNLQYIVEKVISKYGEKWHPRFINAVLMDPNTGEILAAASWPFFNYEEPEKGGPLTPRYAVAPYEPGSVMKPFVLAAALNEGLITPNTVFFCPAHYEVGGKVFHNEFHGRDVKLRAWEIIQYSDNVGIIKVAQLLGKKRLYRYYKAFGFGEKTGIELPGESPGIFRNWKKWREVDFATLAFGHNISVTTLQLAAAYSAMVNGGIYYKPTFLKAVLDDKGRVIKRFTPVAERRVISEKVSKEMRRVLTMVVEEGTGVATKFENFYVGGKTGTARRWNPKLHTYDRTRINATFAGAFPMTNPRYVLVVSVVDPKVPKNMLWASKIAVPIFREIAERVLLYERVVPDRKKYFITGNGCVESVDINKNFTFKNGLQQKKK